MTPQPNENLGTRIPEFDGLRGIAILSVILMHYFYDPVPGLSTPFALFQHIFALGGSGADLHFVLSGFLIGGILLDYHSSKSYFKTFNSRKSFRIVQNLWQVKYATLS